MKSLHKMPLHIIKLSVGTETPAGLREWQTYFRATYGKLFHTTRMTPKRKAEILDGGSIYWVFKGAIRCRQRIIDLEDFVNEEGTKYCRIVLDPELIETRPYPHRAFQGWRYLDPAKAPKDASGNGPGNASGDDVQELPGELVRTLDNLGLL